MAPKQALEEIEEDDDEMKDEIQDLSHKRPF